MIPVPPEVLHCVRQARYSLQQAQFSLDEHGVECVALNDLYSDAAALASEWQGRKPADAERLPPHFVEAAIEYRRERARRRWRAA